MPTYSAYGLSLASDMALPELVTAILAPGARADVRVSREEGEPPREDGFEIEEHSARVCWAGVGTFEARGGKSIVVRAAPGVHDSTLRVLLLGPALALLLRQRGCLVLHASAAALPDGRGGVGGALFLGASGRGKSTLAAALHQAGALLLADDYAALPGGVGREDDGAPMVEAGFPALRLWPGALSALGHDAASLPFLHPPNFEPKGAPRRLKRVWDGLATRARVRALYVLGWGDEVRVEPLSPGQAMPRLIENLYCKGAAGSPESAREFLRCGELAVRVPARLLIRPRDLSRLQDAVAAVQSDLALLDRG